VSTSTALKDDERPGGGRFFDRIANRYDLLNRIVSFGLDIKWRHRLLSQFSDLSTNDTILDVATGTADVAIAIAQTIPGVHVVGLDPSTGMLAQGQKKITAADLGKQIQLTEGKAEALPFNNNSFAGACISFGIRNVPDRLKGLSEMARVTRPGGKVVILELSEPRDGFLAPFARFHVHHVVPMLGALISGSAEYRYLQRSIAAFPPSDAFADLMRQSGLQDVEYIRLSFGSAHLWYGTAG